jgi:hypothetical protein
MVANPATQQQEEIQSGQFADTAKSLGERGVGDAKQTETLWNRQSEFCSAPAILSK